MIVVEYPLLLDPNPLSKLSHVSVAAQQLCDHDMLHTQVYASLLFPLHAPSVYQSSFYACTSSHFLLELMQMYNAQFLLDEFTCTVLFSSLNIYATSYSIYDVQTWRSKVYNDYNTGSKNSLTVINWVTHIAIQSIHALALQVLHCTVRPKSSALPIHSYLHGRGCED